MIERNSSPSPSGPASTPEPAEQNPETSGRRGDAEQSGGRDGVGTYLEDLAVALREVPGPVPAERGLRHGKADELGVGQQRRPPHPPGPSDLVVDLHVQRGQEGIQVLRHNMILSALSSGSRTGLHGLIAARLWLTVYQLPPYAPEFNPVEGVWSHLKRSLANLTKHSLDQLTTLVKTRLKRMRYRPHLIEGLIAKTGLDLQPPQPQPLKIF